jgi:isoleucyl-tRNA synthetase
MTESISAYRATLNLPETPFPMRADLPKREPGWVQALAGEYLALRRSRQNQGAPLFVLHDGPPYANGRLHIGHALNKILKDMVVKTRFLAGFDVSYIPGWDCHGLPIENAVEKKQGGKLERSQMQSQARRFAEDQIAHQAQDFQRLGVLADWACPYRTMDWRNEASQLLAFKQLLQEGWVYRGLKPVHWCFECASSLAEFEIEYQDKSSQTLDVAFLCAQPEQLAQAFGLNLSSLDKPAYAVIWTTTAWTIPANQALNVNPALTYALVETPQGFYVCAQNLVDSCLARWQIEAGQGQIKATALGRQLAHLEFHHPLAHVDPGFARRSPVYLADYVGDSEGTGLVHAAPAYGLEDFTSCTQEGLLPEAILNPVQGNGVFAADLPLFGGQFIWKAIPLILETLRQHGRLLSTQPLTHSYPHCWRHKTPVIYRAAAQWFVRMDAQTPATRQAWPPTPSQNPVNETENAPSQTLRERALAAIEQTTFYPSKGKNRLRDMIANRPDWCISRQRAWGVPIPFFLHQETGQLHPRTLEIMDQAAQLIAQGGIEAWSRLSTEDILNQAGDAPEQYLKSTDILEVWFDSGSTFWHVLDPQQGSHAEQEGMPTAHRQGPQADLYLEGHDQHRGWFHASLLLGCALQGHAPYRALLTHGFATDGQGYKMSKSQGNVVAPQDVTDRFGADILRLWVALTDSSDELSIDEKILSRVVDVYRRLRNTLRFLLANLRDFDSEKDAVPLENLLELDRYALAQAAHLQKRWVGTYQADRGVFEGGYSGCFEFHHWVAQLQVYCAEDLGAFYLDILKDRLYTTAAKSHARRSAQTALWHLTQALLRWMAPFLSFTAQEAWTVLHTQTQTQVGAETQTQAVALPPPLLTQTFVVWPEPEEAFLAKWARIRHIRGLVMQAIEVKRAQGTIGSSLQAEVTLTVSQADADLLASLKDDLRFVLITSQVTVQRGFSSEGGNDELTVEVQASNAPKCERCWHYCSDVGQETAHPTICLRCVGNLAGQEEKTRLWA